MGLFGGGSKEIPAEIVKVKFLGVRQGVESKTLTTQNFAMYSFLIAYSDGKREIKEYSMDNKKDIAAMNTILQYVDM